MQQENTEDDMITIIIMTMMMTMVMAVTTMAMMMAITMMELSAWFNWS